MTDKARSQGGAARGLRALLIGAAVVYPLGLLVLALMLRFVGDRWWVTSVGLFLPRLPYLVPLAPLALALAIWGPRKLLWVQLGAALFVLFVLAGFALPLPSLGSAQAGAARLRVFSCNVNSGASGYPQVTREIVALAPDVVLLQEVFADPEQAAALLNEHFPHVRASTQFVLASRFPIRSFEEPQPLPFGGRQRSPRFTVQVLETTLGPVTFFNVHPVSPRGAFSKMRGQGLRREILSGRIFSGDHAAELRHHTELRNLQIQTFSARAAREPYPTVIAGDFNLPSLSRAHSYLADFQDGFLRAGSGFGYTYPNKPRIPAFMRIDRIYASSELRFESFEVVPATLSDHRCLRAELVRR